ncbi:hypothetical protein [Planktothricoides sp. SR001]|nr:hypothetical protein [Planktothricoides sp. SR001]
MVDGNRLRKILRSESVISDAFISDRNCDTNLVGLLMAVYE